MAPKNQDPKGGGSGKGKMTVLMFQLEATDETLRDAIRVMGHGLEKMAPGAPIYKLIQAPGQTRTNGALPGEEGEAIEPEILEPEESGYEDGESSSSQSGSSEKARTRRIPKAIPAVKGIDWETGTSWKDYATQKNPEGNPSRFVAAAGWFKNIRSLDVITPGHIVAAFDVMDWPKPENIPNTFAQLKHKRAGELFDKGEKPNEWVLSQRGVNALDRLGKEKAK
jgi:hypothetical protein